jgi:hypothetical protein
MGLHLVITGSVPARDVDSERIKVGSVKSTPECIAVVSCEIPLSTARVCRSRCRTSHRDEGNRASFDRLWSNVEAPVRLAVQRAAVLSGIYRIVDDVKRSFAMAP